jgi:hypothetical protein
MSQKFHLHFKFNCLPIYSFSTTYHDADADAQQTIVFTNIQQNTIKKNGMKKNDNLFANPKRLSSEQHYTIYIRNPNSDLEFHKFFKFHICHAEHAWVYKVPSSYIVMSENVQKYFCLGLCIYNI